MLYKSSFSLLITVCCLLLLACNSEVNNDKILTSEDFFEPENSTITDKLSESIINSSVRESKAAKENNSSKNKVEPVKEKSSYKEKYNSYNSDKLANNIKKHIIAMVYPEKYQSSSIQILQENFKDNKVQLNIAVTWKDQWVSKPYRVEGLLEVEKDGTNAYFKIIKKNSQAEALEITYDDFKNELYLSKL